MASTARTVGTGAAMAAVFGYFAVIELRPTLGVLLAALIYLAGWLAAAGWVERTLGARRGIATGGLAALVLGFAYAVDYEPILGLLTAGVVVGVSVATSPRGPLAE